MYRYGTGYLRCLLQVLVYLNLDKYLQVPHSSGEFQSTQVPYPGIRRILSSAKLPPHPPRTFARLWCRIKVLNLVRSLVGLWPEYIYSPIPYIFDIYRSPGYSTCVYGYKIYKCIIGKYPYKLMKFSKFTKFRGCMVIYHICIYGPNI